MDDLLSRPIVLVVALAIVSLLPFAFMTVTAFVKIATVLQIVRSAIGAQGVPSSTIIMALAAALTLVAMAPVGDKIATRAAPLLAAQGGRHRGARARRDRRRARAAARVPEGERERDGARALSSTSRGARGARAPGRPAEVGADDLTVLLPAFVVTELGEAFAIGFLIYLPFLVIDLVISNLLLALGMQMMSPTQVSLPFKLLLFVAIDGWGLLARALVEGYR